MRGGDMQKLRWGLIGCGDISSKRVAPALRDLSNCELVTVARNRVDLTQSFAERFGTRKWHADWHALVQDKEIDASESGRNPVSIATAKTYTIISGSLHT